MCTSPGPGKCSMRVPVSSIALSASSDLRPRSPGRSAPEPSTMGALILCKCALPSSCGIAMGHCSLNLQACDPLPTPCTWSVSMGCCSGLYPCFNAFWTNRRANLAPIKFVQAPGSTIMLRRPSGSAVIPWYACVSGHHGNAEAKLAGVANPDPDGESSPDCDRGVPILNYLVAG